MTCTSRTVRSSSAALTIQDSRSADAAVAALSSWKGIDPIMIFEDHSDSEDNDKCDDLLDKDDFRVVHGLSQIDIDKNQAPDAPRRSSSRSLRDSRGKSNVPLSAAMTLKDSLVADSAMAGLRLLCHDEEDRYTPERHNEPRDPSPVVEVGDGESFHDLPAITNFPPESTEHNMAASRRLERLSANHILTQEDSLEADIAVAGLNNPQHLSEGKEAREDHLASSNSPRSFTRRKLVGALKIHESLMADVAMANVRLDHTSTTSIVHDAN